MIFLDQFITDNVSINAWDKNKNRLVKNVGDILIFKIKIWKSSLMI